MRLSRVVVQVAQNPAVFMAIYAHILTHSLRQFLRSLLTLRSIRLLQGVQQAQHMLLCKLVAACGQGICANNGRTAPGRKRPVCVSRGAGGGGGIRRQCFPACLQASRRKGAFQGVTGVRIGGHQGRQPLPQRDSAGGMPATQQGYKSARAAVIRMAGASVCSRATSSSSSSCSPSQASSACPSASVAASRTWG